MGARHAWKLQSRDDVQLTLVDPAKGHPAPADLHQPGRFDFAVIATPADTHRAVAEPLLAAGVPCLVEKPLAHGLADAEALAAYAALSVGHIERYNPALDPVAEARPRFLQFERIAPYTGRSTDLDVLSDLMVHDLDLAMRFLGAEVHEVRAVGIGVLGAPIDIANARIALGAGVAVLTASRVSREPARRLRLVEEGVYWSVDLLKRTVTRVRWGAGDLDGEAVAVPEADALSREHDAFLRAVRGEAPYPCPGTDGLAALALAEQVRAQVALQR